jgi:hypothetical protein
VPLIGDPKMPTASSAQMSRRSNRSAAQMAKRYLVLQTFLNTNSHKRPVTSNSAPAMTKSNRVQFTSAVNCIAINGASNRIAVVTAMMTRLLFCINSRSYRFNVLGNIF